MLLQVDSLRVEEATSEASEIQSINLWEVLSHMQPFGWFIMVLLFILLLITVYITVERFITIKQAGKTDTNFMNRIRDNISNNKIEAAKAIAMQENTPISRMIEKGIKRLGRPLKDVSTAIENVGNLEVAKLEKNLSTLATISGAAPMLGFLGTVTGMIQAFYKLSAAGSNIETGQLAGGIYEALFTTAFGLIVGILAYISYNWLVSLLQKVIFRMEAYSVEFIDLIQEPTK